MKQKLLEIKNLNKSFQKAKALTDISFEIFEGETLGVVGESGCGKSLIAKTILRIETQDSGNIFFREKNIDSFSLAERRNLYGKIQIVFQDPYSSLNPKMHVSKIISEPLDIHLRLKSFEKEKRIDELLLSVGLETEHKNRYPHEFSGGQRQRIGIARSLALNPELLICDEPISALDVSTQTKIIDLLQKIQKQRSLSLLFISHDLSVVKQISSRILVMYLGHLVEMGDTASIYESPKHPYTQALLSSIPLTDPILEKRRPKIILKGEVPSIFNLPQGCPFHTRCPKSKDICRVKKPGWNKISSKHSVYCHLFADS